MTAAALAFLLLAGTSQTVLVDEPFNVPAGDWRFVDVMLSQTPVKVECVHTTRPGAPGVRIAILSEQDLGRLRSGDPAPVLTKQRFEAQGRFEEVIATPGRYAVVIENGRDPQGATRVHLRVTLDFMPQRVGYVPPRRRLAVILISFAVFFGIVTYSARRLLRAVR